MKTLHPRIHGGLLRIRDDERHSEEMAANSIEPIDMLVVNFYPFEEVVAKEGTTFSEAIENIDIGGPAMLQGRREKPRLGDRAHGSGRLRSGAQGASEKQG